MYGSNSKRESNPNKKWNVICLSLEHRTLPLLEPRSTDWANGPFDKNIEQFNIFQALKVW